MNQEPPADFEGLAEHIRKQVGLLIRKAREEKEWSQGQLAQIMSRRQAYISELETGKTEPSVTTLVELAKRLEKPVLYFIPAEFRDPLQRGIEREELTIEEQEIIRKMREAEPYFNHGLVTHQLNAFIAYAQKVQEIIEE